MQAVVLAGGKGTRLGKRIPKALVPVADVPMLDHILSWLAAEGVTEVVLATGFGAELVAEAVGDGSRFGLRITCVAEDTPLGTAGAVRAARAALRERFFVVYGDVYADVQLGGLLEAHRAAGAAATLVVHPNDHPFDSDRVVTDAAGTILKLVPKEAAAGAEAGALCSAALYVVERAVIDQISEAPSDFARDLFPAMVAAGAKLHAYRTAEYLKDMGTPDRLAKVEDHLRAGVPARLRKGGLRPGVLLDRDGVINEDTPYISDPAQLRLLPGVAASVRKLNAANVAVACCTNQPVIARGELSEEGLEEIHRHLEGLLGKDGAWLDGIFFCPHHPDAGFSGERRELKRTCLCRKPQPGLVRQALDDLGLDPRSSIVVGDRTTDLAAATAAGVVGVGVLTGAACRDRTKPLAPESLLLPSLAEAAALVLTAVPSAVKWCEAAEAARVVLIGGASRAGKTYAATALRLALQARGHVVTHVSLDRFITARSQRSPDQSLKDRLGFTRATDALLALSQHRSALFDGYDPLLRERGPSRVVHWSRSGILLVDGLLACALPLAGAFTVAMHASEGALSLRRADFYRWKGTPADDGRAEEDRLVHESTAGAMAHLTISDDGALQERR